MVWRRKEKPAGDIAGAGLTDWWLKSFTREQHDYIATKFQPMGNPQKRCLVEGTPHRQDAGKLLLGLSSWFRGPKDRYLERILLEETIRRTASVSMSGEVAKFSRT